jgi:(p)ppGpp synthase/HD superfamily hydrolase
VNTLDKAIAFALKWHFGHANKHDGEPYVLHLQRVAIAARNAGGSEDAQAIAWLHDVVEDRGATWPDLVDAGFNRNIVEGVLLLSKTGEENRVYYERIRDSGNVDAILVKNCDLRDNFRRNHLIEDDAKRLRMGKKYSMGMDILGG